MKASIRFRTVVVATLAALTPSLAFAHSGGYHVHGLVMGLEHPVFALDHLLAMVAVGMIAARTGGRGVLVVPLSFVSAMAAGALLGMAGLGLPSLETGVALSLVVFGAVIGLHRPVPLAAAAALAAVFGVFHGNAHGLEIPESAGGGLAYAAGFIFATSALHAIGAISGLKLAGWPTALRTAGIGTSLVGIAMAAQTI
jgi:urease accessory protein